MENHHFWDGKSSISMAIFNSSSLVTPGYFLVLNVRTGDEWGWFFNLCSAYSHICYLKHQTYDQRVSLWFPHRVLHFPMISFAFHLWLPDDFPMISIIFLVWFSYVPWMISIVFPSWCPGKFQRPFRHRAAATPRSPGHRRTKAAREMRLPPRQCCAGNPSLQCGIFMVI